MALASPEDSAITVPSELLIEHGDHQYIQLRPTNHAICQLICGSNIPKNASISACTKLHEIIQQRNQAMHSDEASEQKDDLFPSNEEPILKKKKGMKILPPTVSITASKSDEKPMVDILSAKPHVVALLQNSHMTMGCMPLECFFG
eukprot:s10724_g1.t1